MRIAESGNWVQEVVDEQDRSAGTEREVASKRNQKRWDYRYLRQETNLIMTLPRIFLDAQMLVWIRGQLENVQKLYYSISALAPSGGSGMNDPEEALLRSLL